MVFAGRSLAARVGHNQRGAIRPILDVYDAAGMVFAQVITGAGVNDEDLFRGAQDNVIVGSPFAEGQVEVAVDVRDHADALGRLAFDLVQHGLERFQGALGELRRHDYGVPFCRVIILPVRADSKIARLISAAR